MVIFGIDADERSHTVVAVDQQGRKLRSGPSLPSAPITGAAGVGRVLRALPPLGGRGLPSPLATSRAGPSGCRRNDRAGATEDDGPQS